MAINYRKKNWIEGQTFDPDTMNYLDGGIQQACDGVDALANVPTDLARNGLGEQSGSRNLLNYHDVTETSGFEWAPYIPCRLKKGTYTFSCKSTSTSGQFNFRLSKNGTEIYSTTFNHSANVSGTFTITDDVDELRGYSNRGCTMSDFQIEEGTVAHAYEPYYESNKMLTDDTNEIASLKFLGWTVPREMPIKNYVDSEGKFHQRVGRVDLGTLTWSKATNYFYSNVGNVYKYPPNSATRANVYCNKYPTVASFIITNASQDKVIGATQDGYYVLRDTSYSDVNTLKSALTGTYLYYELSTEVLIAEGNELTPIRYADVTLGNITIPSNGYYEFNSPVPNNAKATLGVTIQSWTKNSGAFACIPYGDGKREQYVIGTPGVTVNTLALRFWYTI